MSYMGHLTETADVCLFVRVVNLQLGPVVFLKLQVICKLQSSIPLEFRGQIL